MSFQNPTYASCLSFGDVDLKTLKEFGDHIVEVNDPEAFFRRLHASATSLRLGKSEVDFVDCFPVRYSKGLEGPAPSDASELMRLSYGQKSLAFQAEREYRCVIVLSGASADAPSSLELDLGDVSGFVRRYRED